MEYKPGILLGQIIKTSGFEGAVIIRLEKKFIDNIPELESVFLEIDGKPVPFFISEYHESGPELRVIFNDYASTEKVTEFKGCKVFLTTRSKCQAEEPDISSLDGFTVLDQDGKKLGYIREIIPGPGQLLLSIEDADHNELLIPLHEDLIIDINKSKKSLRMEVPEGLTDINR